MTATLSDSDADDRARSRPAIRLRGLTKCFGDKVAVGGIDLDIPSSSFFGICGPNGAGKTTTIRMATGLLRPDAGTVEIAGADVWTNPVEAKQRFGLVEDKPRLFERLNARELLEYTGLLRRMDSKVIAHRSTELLSAVDLEGDARTLVADFSLGMTKRIAVAVALLHAPKVLLLDEPFSALDPVNSAAMEAILRRFISGGGTVVFSSHVMDVVERLCDRIVIVSAGTVLREGTVAEVTNGHRLLDVFVDLVGAREIGEGQLEWLGSSSD
jgi:ABC-2 type transport system ATP-binding protein